jgi:hypothetical protein
VLRSITMSNPDRARVINQPGGDGIGRRRRRWRLTTATRLIGVNCATIEEPFLMRRPTSLSFSARRSSLRSTAALIARAARITI